MSYKELAERLKKHGHDETESSVANKLSRGPATFLLASLVAIGCEVVKLEDIQGSALSASPSKKIVPPIQATMSAFPSHTIRWGGCV